jgi:YhcH/YjgK/YiaL family protein
MHNGPEFPLIIDCLEDARRYARLHPLFPRAFETLERGDLMSLPSGKHAIEGDRLYLVIALDLGAGAGGAVLEAHRKYIDIQFVIEGTDMIGWRPVRECSHVSQPYDASKDVELYAESPLAWSPLAGSRFAVYFPADAHAPLGGTGRLRRAIVKVAI